MFEIKDLFFSYNKSAPYLLNNINLKVNKGDYISILGENGSGKSTLMKLLLKLLTPSKGEIVRNAMRIGYVPQKFESFNSQFPITVYELLKINGKYLKIKDVDLIFNLLDLIKMRDFKDSLVGTLSGGQFQKVLIAKALMGNPDVLILDEPSNGIDVNSQAEIYSLIKKLNKENKITVLSVEHNIKAAIANSSSIFYIDNGVGSKYTPNEYLSIYDEGRDLFVAL
jgi:zinc transport system ATP-binding protein